MPPDNRSSGKPYQALSEVLSVIEPQLRAIKELTTDSTQTKLDISQLRSGVEHQKEDLKKLNKFIFEGSGRPSLIEKVKETEEKVNGVRDKLTHIEDLQRDTVTDLEELEDELKVVLQDLGARAKVLEEKIIHLEKLQEESSGILTKIPERVSQIKEQVGSIEKSHEDHSNRTKVIWGSLGSLALAAIPLIWQAVPPFIKWIEVQKYNTQLYDKHIEEIKNHRNDIRPRNPGENRQGKTGDQTVPPPPKP